MIYLNRGWVNLRIIHFLKWRIHLLLRVARTLLAVFFNRASLLIFIFHRDWIQPCWLINFRFILSLCRIDRPYFVLINKIYNVPLADIAILCIQVGPILTDLLLIDWLCITINLLIIVSLNLNNIYTGSNPHICDSLLVSLLVLIWLGPIFCIARNFIVSCIFNVVLHVSSILLVPVVCVSWCWWWVSLCVFQYDTCLCGSAVHFVSDIFIFCLPFLWYHSRALC